MIENAPLVPYYEKKFQSDAVARTVHHGTHIEGNDLNLDQTMKILEGEKVFGRDRDVQEVINYRNVVSLLDDLVNKRDVYNIETLKEIHFETVNKIVPEEKVGSLRNVQVVIREQSRGEVVLEPPPAAEVPYLLDDFFAWLASDTVDEIHPILLAGIAHYILVAIHPFVEGNGRTARAFATLVMLKKGYDIKRFFALEEHFDSDPAAYYEAFAEVDKQSKNLAARDMTPWLEYFTEVVAVELNKIKETVRKLSIDSRLRNRIGQQVSLSERQMKMIEYMAANGQAKMKELKQVMSMVSEDTILRDLNDMMEKGILDKRGKTKASRYIIVN